MAITTNTYYFDTNTQRIFGSGNFFARCRYAIDIDDVARTFTVRVTGVRGYCSVGYDFHQYLTGWVGDDKVGTNKDSYDGTIEPSGSRYYDGWMPKGSYQTISNSSRTFNFGIDGKPTTGCFIYLRDYNTSVWWISGGEEIKASTKRVYDVFDEVQISIRELYQKAIFGITSPANLSYCIHKLPVTVNYNANTAYDADQVSSVVKYRVNGSDWITVEGSGNSAGSFTFSPVDFLVAENSTMVIEAYREHSSGKTIYDSDIQTVTVYTYDYSRPTISLLPPLRSMTAYNEQVNINYSSSLNFIDGLDSMVVQYKINGGSLVTAAGPSGTNSSGTISFVPSDKGISQGQQYTVEVSRYNNNKPSYNVIGFTANMQTYSVPTVSGIVASPSATVNANTQTTLTWNKWVGLGSEPSSCKVEIVDSQSQAANVISTIANSNTDNSVVFLPSNFVGLSYTNQQIYIRITRTHSITGVVSTPAYFAIKVRYTPTSAITGLSPNPCGTIIENKAISWTYPSGYNGIVSGYRIILSNAVSDQILYYSSIGSVLLLVASMIPTKYYNISISAFYAVGNTYYYGPETAVLNYVRYDAGLETPVITYPTGGYWKDGSFRVALTLPKDSNFASLLTTEQNSYVYSDIEVNINDVPYKFSTNPLAFSLNSNSLKHMVGLVFNPVLASVTSSQSYSVKVRVYGDTRFCTRWSDYSSSKTMSVLSEPSSLSFLTAGSFVTASDYALLRDYLIALINSYGGGYSDLNIVVGSKILASNYTTFSDRIVELVNKINSGYMFDKANVKFSEVTPLDTASNRIIYSTENTENPAPYESLLLKMIQDLT